MFKKKHEPSVKDADLDGTRRPARTQES